MPLVQTILFYIPVLPLGAIMVFLAVAFSITGLLIVWRFVPRQMLKTHNDLTGALFGTVSSAYTVLLAFVVVISWQNFDKAQTHAIAEANCVVDIYRSSAAFMPEFASDIRSLVKQYVDIVVNQEWASLGRGEESLKARAVLKHIWASFTGYEPKTEKEKVFLAECVDKLGRLREMRRLRIIDANSGVHPILWFVLVVGAITTISFSFLFGSNKFIVHAVMACILSVIIALILLTIISFNFPFTGSVRIGPEAFQQVIIY